DRLGQGSAHPQARSGRRGARSGFKGRRRIGLTGISSMVVRWRPSGPVGPAIRAVVADACRGRLLGVEREYEIADDQGSVDARRLWPLLPDPGAATDPGDPQA